MTTEEKARAYDMALEAMSDIIPDENGLVHIRPSDIFPELAESGDERIRKAQLDYWRSVGGKEWHGVPVQEAITWLEKQGEQKHTFRERYENIAKSEWFKRTYDGISVSDDEESKRINEDEMIRKSLIDFFDNANKVGENPMYEYGIHTDKILAWLEKKGEQKTIETTWKPSEEQIKILDEILNFAANHESPYWNDYIFGTLNNLIRQLKELKNIKL